MKRFYPLTVDRLEDRCVPTTVTDTQAIAAATTTTVLVADPSATTTTTTTVAPTDGTTSYVIDVYPTDPTAPVDSSPTAPSTTWGAPVETVPPVDSPFWY